MRNWLSQAGNCVFLAIDCTLFWKRPLTFCRAKLCTARRLIWEIGDKSKDMTTSLEKRGSCGTKCAVTKLKADQNSGIVSSKKQLSSISQVMEWNRERTSIYLMFSVVFHNSAIAVWAQNGTWSPDSDACRRDANELIDLLVLYDISNIHICFL